MEIRFLFFFLRFTEFSYFCLLKPLISAELGSQLLLDGFAHASKNSYKTVNDWPFIFYFEITRSCTPAITQRLSSSFCELDYFLYHCFPNTTRKIHSMDRATKWCCYKWVRKWPLWGYVEKITIDSRLEVLKIVVIVGGGSVSQIDSYRGGLSEWNILFTNGIHIRLFPCHGRF